MMRKQICAAVLICSLLFSNISWAAADPSGQNVRETGSVEELSGSGQSGAAEATSSDADREQAQTATASNSLALVALKSEFPVHVELLDNTGEFAAYSGQSFRCRITVGKSFPEGAQFRLVIRDGDGERVAQGDLHGLWDFDNLKPTIESLSLPAGDHVILAEDSDGTVFSEDVPVKISRGDSCRVMLNSAPKKKFGEKDEKTSLEARLPNGGRVSLYRVRFLREQGEDAGEYAITGITSQDYDTVEFAQSEYNKLVIEKGFSPVAHLRDISACGLAEIVYDVAEYFPKEAKIEEVFLGQVSAADQKYFGAGPEVHGTKVTFRLNEIDEADVGKTISIPIVVRSKNYHDVDPYINLHLQETESKMMIAPIDGGGERPLSAYNGYQARILVFGHAKCENTRAVSKTVQALTGQYEGYVKGFFFDTVEDLPATRDFSGEIGDMVVCNQKDSGIDYGRWAHTLLRQAGKDTDADVLPAVFLIDRLGATVYCSPTGEVSKGTIESELKKMGVKSIAERTADIKAFKSEHPFSTSQSVTYKTAPNLSAWQEGALDDKSVQNGLNALNFVRYIAGVPADVKNNETYQMQTQKGSVMLAKLGYLDHRPDNPGLPEDFYQDAFGGTSRSNLAQGYRNIADSVINAYMDDGDVSNIDRVGHRRWCLNPSMKETGFGYYKSFSALYAFDNSGENPPCYVPWPARVMPREYFAGPWSVSFGGEVYDLSGDIAVTMSDGKKTCTFSGDRADGYFNVDQGGYGSGPAVIFKPNAGFGNNARVEVTISGVKDGDGYEQDIHYVVQFFGMSSGSSPGGGGGSTPGGGGGGGSSSGGGGGGGGTIPAKTGTAVADGGGALPNYVIRGTWAAADGNWRFTDFAGTPYVNRWAAVENPYADTAQGQQAFDWFFFDAGGNMLTGWHKDADGTTYYLNPNSDGSRGKMVTGWVWIPDRNGVKKCYYFNPNSDGHRGMLMTGAVIDGSTVNDAGEWVLGGVVQTQ